MSIRMSPHLTPQNSIQMVDTNDFAVIISLLFWFIDGTHNINQPLMINEISLKSNFWAPPNDNERMIDWLINANFDTNNFHISLSRWYFCGISWSTLNANHDRFPAFRAQYHFQLIVKFIDCFFSSFVKHDEIINRNCQHCHWNEKKQTTQATNVLWPIKTRDEDFLQKITNVNPQIQYACRANFLIHAHIRWEQYLDFDDIVISILCDVV